MVEQEYAKALYEISLEENKTKEFKEYFNAIKDTLEDDFLTLIASPAIIKEEKKKMVANIYHSFDETFINFLYVLIDHNRFNMIVAISKQYDKLILEVWTNGSITPEEAIALGSRILIEHFNVLTALNEIADETGMMIAKVEDPNVKILETSIDDLDLSVRAYNCLKRAGIASLKDLVGKSENEMMKIRNLGKKSLKEVMDKVKDMGLSFRNED